MTTDQIDALVKGIFDVLAAIYPPIGALKFLIIPLLRAAISSAATSIAKGIADGTIVPDGRGGFIPAHGQSKYDPATGEFTGEKT